MYKDITGKANIIKYLTDTFSNFKRYFTFSSYTRLKNKGSQSLYVRG